MILEHAHVTVDERAATDYEATMLEAFSIVESAPGCHGAELRRQVEDPSTYLLLITWDDVAAHAAFRASDAYQEWRTLTHPWYTRTPIVTHYDEAIGRP